MEDFFTKTDELLEQEFDTNKELNRTLAPEHRLPENMVEYVERLVIENIRNLKFLEKENIPEDLKSHRLEYLQNQQQSLLDQLSKLKAGDED
jgi:hypothetical protein